MNEEYDSIIVGAGNAGLMAALNIAKNGKNVLILESNSMPGGLATSFVRGRFEFEASLRELNDFGSETNKGDIRSLFDKFDLNESIEWVELPEAYKIIKTNNPKEEYVIPFGIDEFIKKMEEIEEGSKDKVSEFFELAKEVYNGVSYIKNNGYDYDYLKSNYPIFVNTASYSVDEVFKKLKLPKKIEDIIKSYWIYFGVSSINMNFAQYIYFFYQYINMKGYVPKNRSQEISNAIESKIIGYGGRIYYNETVNKILVENNEVCGVTTKKGNIYKSKHVIVNSSPLNVYSTMLDNVPSFALKLTNSRKLGAKAITVYLGLNKSASELGIKNYMYLVYNDLDSNIESEKMKSIDSNTIIVTCLNNAVSDASVEGTAILTITALYFDNPFDKVLNEEIYYSFKEKIANKLINRLETALGVNIKENIEEIEISTPITYSKYNSSPDGCIYGYTMNNFDSSLSRMSNKNEDNVIKGLRLCGSYSYYGHGYDNTYLNGYEISNMTLKDIEMDGEK